MSFSSEIKEELSRQIPGARHCRLAEIPVCQGHGAMLSSRAAYGYDKLILSLLHIVGKKETNHVLQFIQKTVRRLETHDEILYLLIVSAQPAEIFIVIRIGQETHVENQICVIGNRGRRRFDASHAHGKSGSCKKVLYIVEKNL